MININATILLTILNFILLVIVLRLILFRPLVKFLDERSRTIAESLKQAEENQRRSGEMNAEKDAVIAEARRKASDIIEKATAGAHEESHESFVRPRGNPVDPRFRTEGDCGGDRQGEAGTPAGSRRDHTIARGKGAQT